MTKVFGYCRTSSTTNSDGATFPRQASTIRRFAIANGMEVERFFEETVSGTTEWEHRPQWVDMIQSLNGVRTIVIERLDRLARDLMVQERILVDLKERDITLISVAEPDLCSDDPTRKLMRQIIGAICSYERTMIVAKLRDARTRKRAETGSCEGRKPYGDRPYEGGTIERMLTLRSAGMSYAQIAETLNATPMAHPTRTGKPWFASVVRDILQRESYPKLNTI